VGGTCSMHGQFCTLRVVGKEGVKVWNEYSLVRKSVGWPEFLVTKPKFQEFFNPYRTNVENRVSS